MSRSSSQPRQRSKRAWSEPSGSRRGGACAKARQLIVMAAATVSIAYLVVFHGLLLWRRILDLTLFEPLPALRWLATAAVLFAIVRLRRQGVSLVRGRPALVIWLLVLLLHVSVSIPPAGSPADTRPEAGLLLVLPAATAFGALLVLFYRRRVARVLTDGQDPRPACLAAAAEIGSYALRAGFLPAIACRPPPAR